MLHFTLRRRIKRAGLMCYILTCLIHLNAFRSSPATFTAWNNLAFWSFGCKQSALCVERKLGYLQVIVMAFVDKSNHSVLCWLRVGHLLPCWATKLSTNTISNIEVLTVSKSGVSFKDLFCTDMSRLRAFKLL